MEIVDDTYQRPFSNADTLRCAGRRQGFVEPCHGQTMYINVCMHYVIEFYKSMIVMGKLTGKPYLCIIWD